MVDNKYDVELVVVEGIELVGYLLYKCLFFIQNKHIFKVNKKKSQTYEKFQVE
jgi:hypothetical protein